MAHLTPTRGSYRERLKRLKADGKEFHPEVIEAGEWIWEQAAEAVRLEHAQILIYFGVGKKISEVTERIESERGSTYGLGLIDQFHELTGIHPNTLRVARRVAEKFSRSEKLFREEIEQRARDGKKTNWMDCEYMVRASSDPEVLGQEALLKRTIRRIERTAEDISQINELLQSYEGEDRGELEAQARGVLLKVLEETEELKDERLTFEDPTPRRQVLQPYIDYLKEFPCPFTGELGVDPSHPWTRGAGGSDLLAVPMSREVHNEFHQMGIHSFGQKWGPHFGMEELNWHRLAMNYLSHFIYGEFLDLDLPEIVL